MDVDGLRLRVGGMPRAVLLARLAAAGVELNAHAETVLAHALFDDPPVVDVVIAERSVADLGLPAGGTSAQVFSAAAERGLAPAPAWTAPFLRLAFDGQPGSDDPRLSVGAAPDGSLTVASVRVEDDEQYPAGFYLRVVDGRPWLRGYRAGEDHVWNAADRFAFVTG